MLIMLLILSDSLLHKPSKILKVNLIGEVTEIIRWIIILNFSTKNI